MDEHLRDLERRAREGDPLARFRLQSAQARRPIPCPFCRFTQKRLDDPSRTELSLVHRARDPWTEDGFLVNDFAIRPELWRKWTFERTAPADAGPKVLAELQQELREIQRREFPCPACHCEWEIRGLPPVPPA